MEKYTKQFFFKFSQKKSYIQTFLSERKVNAVRIILVQCTYITLVYTHTKFQDSWLKNS